LNPTITPPQPDAIAYTCFRVSQPIAIDGDLTKPAWQHAPRSHRLVDMVSGAPGLYDTRIACLWDDAALYAAFWVEEPYITAQLTERDSTIFQENDIELFIDGGDWYYELEVNALGTIYEILYVWRDAYTRGSRWDVPEFDVHAREAYTFGGDYDRQAATFWRGTHPRGVRWAFTDWDYPGLEVAVQADGVVNDDTTPDRGWTVEMALPWAGLTSLVDDRPVPPNPGDIWRLFFGRFQKLMVAGQEVQPHPAWVLTPHGIYDTHQPQLFSRVQFAGEDVAEQ